MVSRTSRRIAVPMVVACFGVFGAAEAAHAAGGLSVTPAVLEHRAALGTVGSLTLNNTTNESLRVTVNVRPWRQELNGKVLTDPRATFNRYVRATRRSFTHRRRRQGAGHLPDGAAAPAPARSTATSTSSASRPTPRAARASSRSTG